MPQFTIAKKLGAMCALGVVTTAATGGVALFQFADARASLRGQTEVAAAVRAQTLIDMMHDAIRADAYAYALARNEAEREQVRADGKEHRDLMTSLLAEQKERIRAGVIGGDAAKAVNASTPQVEAYVTTSEALLKGPAVGSGVLAARASFQEAFERLEVDLEAAGEAVENAGAKEAKHAQDRLARARNILAGVGLVAIIALIVVSWRVARTIANRMRRLNDALRQAAAKDLTVAVADRTEDEIGSMAGALAVSLDTTRRAMEAIRSSAGSLSEQSRRLASVSRQLGTGAEQTSSDVGSVASNSQQVNESVTTVAESTQSLSQSIAEISSSASRVAAIAAHAVSIASRPTTPSPSSSPPPTAS